METPWDSGGVRWSQCFLVALLCSHSTLILKAWSEGQNLRKHNQCQQIPDESECFLMISKLKKKGKKKHLIAQNWLNVKY